MKLVRESDLEPHGSGILVRHSRLRATLGLLVVSGVLVGLPILMWWRWDAPRFPTIVFALVAFALVPLVLSDLPARYRRTNWVVSPRPGGLWINLRSYQQRGPAEGPSVLELSDRDLLEARMHTERYTSPDGRGRTKSYCARSLELLLAQADDGTLAAAIADGRRSPPTGLQVTVNCIEMPAPNRLRVVWSDRTHHLVPSLAPLLAQLETRVKVAQPTETQGPDWRNMSDAELDEHLSSLLLRGDRVGAVQVLARRRKIPLTDAQQCINELTQKP